MGNMEHPEMSRLCENHQMMLARGGELAQRFILKAREGKVVSFLYVDLL